MGEIMKRVVASLGVATAAVLVVGGVAVSSSVVSKTNSNDDKTEKQKVETERTVAETKKEPIGYETKEVEDDSMNKGETKVQAEGVKGEKTYTYSVTYKGGKEISRELVKEEVTKQPVAKVILIGTKTWRCIDVTSYDRNPNNDNLCTSSKGEKRYVNDCEASKLDPYFVDSGKGSSRYNRPCN